MNTENTSSNTDSLFHLDIKANSSSWKNLPAIIKYGFQLFLKVPFKLISTSILSVILMYITYVLYLIAAQGKDIFWVLPFLSGLLSMMPIASMACLSHASSESIQTTGSDIFSGFNVSVYNQAFIILSSTILFIPALICQWLNVFNNYSNDLLVDFLNIFMIIILLLPGILFSLFSYIIITSNEAKRSHIVLSTLFTSVLTAITKNFIQLFIVYFVIIFLCGLIYIFLNIFSLAVLPIFMVIAFSFSKHILHITTKKEAI